VVLLPSQRRKLANDVRQLGPQNLTVGQRDIRPGRHDDGLQCKDDRYQIPPVGSRLLDCSGADPSLLRHRGLRRGAELVRDILLGTPAY